MENNLLESFKGDKVLLRRGTENKQEQPYTGPHTILTVADNGTVRLKVKSVIDSYNICRLMPYNETYDSNHGGECSMRNAKSRRKKDSEEYSPSDKVEWEEEPL